MELAESAKSGVTIFQHPDSLHAGSPFCIEAREACMHWLAIREHSRVELVNKLKAKDFDEIVICQVLDELTGKGLQSDGRFIESFLQSQYEKGHGPGRICQELAQRGITGEDLIKRLDAYDWDGLMARVNQKKFGDELPSSHKEFAARLRFLSQRGFEEDRIQDFLRRLCRVEDY